jgi:hypothetical protein
MPASPVGEALVQVVGPEDGWVLERLARRLAAKLPYAAFVPWKPIRDVGACLAYYVNYALYDGPSGLIDVAFFTHLDEAQQFLERARRVDFCVCMAKQYADWLRTQGVESVAHVPMGFDAYRYRPRLVLGVIGKLAHPRKGRPLVDRLRELPFVEVVVTEGRVGDEALGELYQRVDYVLIPATVEGGPMSLLEGLALGKPVIAPEGVGMVPEFGPSDSIRLYPAGDAEALIRVVTDCYLEKARHAELVRERTWDRWAEGHHEIFMRLLREHGYAVPDPGPGFRFGMLGELDIPPGVEVSGLEEAIDRAAAHLYFGRDDPARSALQEAVRQYPFAAKLLESIPGDKEHIGLPSRAERPHLKALRRGGS